MTIDPTIPTVVADWEGTLKWRLWTTSSSSSGGNETFASREEMLDGTAWGRKKVNLIIENAHLHERRPLSVAQVYTADELVTLYNNALNTGTTVLAFPQRLSQRARVESKITSKSEDPKAIAKFVMNHPEIALKRWRPLRQKDKELHEVMNAIRADMTERLNIMRSSNYKDDDAKEGQKVITAIAGKLTKDCREYFGLEQLNKSGDFKTPKWAQMMPLYVCVFDGTGRLRLNNQKKFIGLDFIWSKLLLMSPFHGRSGTARANLMFYGLRNYDRKNTNKKYKYNDTKKEHLNRRAVWRKWRKLIKEFLRALRDADQAAASQVR